MPPKSILIVEDEAFERVFYQEVLSLYGYDVSVAENGKKALLLMKNHKFDLILLDILMPELDGITLLEMVTAEELMKQGPIYMFSVISQKNIIDNSLKRGAKGYIIKSNIDPEKLLNKIKTILSN